MERWEDAFPSSKPFVYSTVPAQRNYKSIRQSSPRQRSLVAPSPARATIMHCSHPSVWDWARRLLLSTCEGDDVLSLSSYDLEDSGVVLPGRGMVTLCISPYPRRAA